MIGKPPSDGEFDFKISDAGGKFNNDNDIPSVFKYGVTLPELACIIHEPKNKEPEKLDVNPVFLGFK